MIAVPAIETAPRHWQYDGCVVVRLEAEEILRGTGRYRPAVPFPVATICPTCAARHAATAPRNVERHEEMMPRRVPRAVRFKNSTRADYIYFSVTALVRVAGRQ